MTALFPTELLQSGSDKLGIIWSDGHHSEYRVRMIRLACRCAGCVDEWTRERLLKDEDISLDIKPKKIETVGRYALGFLWSDGHDSGIYSFELLRSLCECEKCKPV